MPDGEGGPGLAALEPCAVLASGGANMPRNVPRYQCAIVGRRFWGILVSCDRGRMLMIGCGLVYRLPAGTAKQLRAIICMHPLSCIDARRSHVEPSVVLIRLILRRHTRSSWRGSQLRRSPGIRELRRASVVGSAQHHIGRAFRNLSGDVLSPGATYAMR